MADLQLGNIKPAGGDNVVVDSKYVKGGYVTVANISERNALVNADTKNIIKGSLCYCQTENKFYQFNGTEWVAALEAEPIVAITKAEIDALWADTPEEPGDTPAEPEDIPAE
jgi:hypothetical protein